MPEKAEGATHYVAMTRRGRMKLLGIKPTLPSCRAEYLVRTLFEVGPDSSGSALSFTELVNWQNSSGVELSAWESETLRRSSIAYLNQSQASTAFDCDPPYQTEESRLAEAVARAEFTKQNLRDLAG